jgi:hypothetical protein
VIELLPQIEPVLKAKGEKVVRPNYDQTKGGGKAAEQLADDDESEEEEAGGFEPASKTAGRLDKFKHKQNHEATSEEDDG